MKGLKKWFSIDSKSFEILVEGEGRSLKLGSTDMDTTIRIRHGGIRGHDKFQRTRTQIRQGHDIIKKLKNNYPYKYYP